jgi:hypothetical protein
MSQRHPLRTVAGPAAEGTILRWLDEQARKVELELKFWHANNKTTPALYVRFGDRGTTPGRAIIAELSVEEENERQYPGCFRVVIGRPLSTCPYSNIRKELETAQIEV